LQEVQDDFFQMRQDDLFQESDIDADDDFEQLKNIIGVEKAVRVVEFFAGSTIYVPKNIVTEQTHRRIREEFKNGAVYRELALRYGYSERYVRTIIHGKERKNGQ
jgi:Mor family transcriptional regulator